MKKILIIIIIVLASNSVYLSCFADSIDLMKRVSGRILLQVQDFSRAWYVLPDGSSRYPLNNPEDAFYLMSFQSLGITNNDLERIKESENDDDYDEELTNRLNGYILLQVEENGEAWYVDPKDNVRYFLGRPDSAFSILFSKGIAVSNDEIKLIGLGK